MKIAILIPAYNEEVTIAKVVKDFKESLPHATIYVFDNNSTDQTGLLAQEAGAHHVISSPIQGKGAVVRHMFDIVEADYYIMIDGDDTYPAQDAPTLLQMAIDEKVDMLVGQRLKNFTSKSFPLFHQFGNKMITLTIRKLFNVELVDVLSGYRIFGRRFVKSIPLTSTGFDIETELTLKSIAYKYRLKEHPIEYGERPEGSFSKLNTVTDGLLVFRAIFSIFRVYRPLLFFGLVASFLAILSLSFGFLPIEDYLEFGRVDHLPLAVLASATGILSFILFTCGIILDSMGRYHREMGLMVKGLHQEFCEKSISHSKSVSSSLHSSVDC